MDVRKHYTKLCSKHKDVVCKYDLILVYLLLTMNGFD